MKLDLAVGELQTFQVHSSYRYDPNGQFEALRAGQTATDSFLYTMADAAGATSTATATDIKRAPINSRPARNSYAAFWLNQKLAILTAGVLGNDTYVDAGDT